MQLILTEYISSLKEDGELDKLVQDILKAHGATIISKPQRGRQHGVDVCAIGPDFEGDGQKTVFLITVKQGDLSRQVWNGDVNAVYQSLEEIRTVYIRSNLAKQYQKYPVKIVVAFNGDFHQNLQQSWRGYEEANPGYSYALWSIGWFVRQFEDKLLNEESFNSAIRSELRKTIIHLENADYDLSDLTRLLELVSVNYKGVKTKKGRLKTLKELHVIISIVLKYCEQANNLLHAVKVAEQYFLMLWSELIPEKPEREYTLQFIAAQQLVTDTFIKYINKLGYVTEIKDGFNRGHNSSITYTANLYTQLGIFAMAGLSLVFMNELLISDDEPVVSEIRKLYHEKAEETAAAIIHSVNHNSIFYSPRADDHHIEITLIFLLLHRLGYSNEISTMLFMFNQQMGEGLLFLNVFPVLNNSRREIAELDVDYTKRQEFVYKATNLFTVLVEWSVVINDKKSYQSFRLLKERLLKDTELLLWFPEKETENLLYSRSATQETGYTLSGIELSEKMEEYADIMREEYAANFAEKEFSFIKNGFWIIGLMASRRYRTYIFPHYWRQLLAPPKLLSVK